MIWFKLPNLRLFQSSPNNLQRISLKSDIKNIKPTVINGKELSEEIDRFDIFSPNKISLKRFYLIENKIPVNPSVESIVIHLTAEEQPLEKVKTISSSGEEYTMQSFGLKYNAQAQELTVLLFVNQRISSKETDDKTATRYSVELIRALFYITHPQVFDLQNKELQSHLKKVYSVSNKSYIRSN
ncbi:MAG: hypothetical protein ABIO02_03920 [Patescibacteria group bacterium]